MGKGESERKTVEEKREREGDEAIEGAEKMKKMGSRFENERERERTSGWNKTDKIYIRHCFGFIDINIYSDLALCWRMCTCFAFVYENIFFPRFIVFNFFRIFCFHL